MDDKKPKPAKAKQGARSRSTGTRVTSSAKPRTKAARETAPTRTRNKRVSLPPPAPETPTSRRREVAKKVAISVALAALDKKAERVEIVDIGEKVDYADYLVVMTGRSDRQVVAIAQGIEEALEKQGIRAHGREGVQQGHWVLIDVSDVIVHIFLEEARRYYDLEGLWMDAPRVPTPSFIPPPGPSHEG